MSNILRSILLVEKDPAAREELAMALRKNIDCVVAEAATALEVLDILAQEDICVLIAGNLHSSDEQIELLKNVHRNFSHVITIPCVPLGNQEAIVQALKMGCFTYLNYPYHTGEAIIAAARGLSHHDLINHKETRGFKVRKSDGFYGIIGNTQNMRTLFEMIERVAEDADSTVLVRGESGTGKELVARAIHAFSGRKGRNFVPVNCAAIPDELLESELFGHLKGAFTGAVSAKMGRFQFADGGTIFLDEIGDMKPSLQAKLLRVLQEKTFEPVGGLKPIPVDVRIVAATHRNLEQMVAEGRFREDLFYRLNVIPLIIPPLRERKEDIPLLIENFVRVYNRNRKYRLRGFETGAVAALMKYAWPGNVRELENLVQRMVILHGGGSIDLSDLPEKYAPDAANPAPTNEEEYREGVTESGPTWSSAGIDFNALVDEFESRLIRQALNLSSGNKKEAARLLKLNRTTLLDKIKKKGLELS
jgi:DNA-binding NtrC family response regulator